MWTIDPKIPLSLWWALAVGCAAALIYYVARSDWGLSTARRVAIGVLLLLGVAGPLAIALNPTWMEPIPPVPGQPLLSILVDGTTSMNTADALPGGSETRWQAATNIAGAVRNASHVEVVRQVFDHQLHPLKPPDEAAKEDDPWPRGYRSDLANALRESMRQGSPAGQAVLLVSDGAHNAGSVDGLFAAAREAQSLNVPIYTVTLGAAVGAKNLSVAARNPRMIAFADNPLVMRVRIGQSGLGGQSTQVALMNGDTIVQSRPIRLTNEQSQEVSFVLPQPPKNRLQRFRIVAAEIEGEATAADNQTTILVQRLDQPIGVMLLEGKPYWDSKFLARNLGADPLIELKSIIQLSSQRFLVRNQSAAGKEDAPVNTPAQKPASDNAADEKTADGDSANGEGATKLAGASGWEIQRDLSSPLERLDTLEKCRVVILGRDADAFLTEKGIENLRQWISKSGGCLLCARGAPANEVVRRLAEILPVRWAAAPESHIRTKVSQYGFDAAVFDPLMPDGSDPLAALPSLSLSATPTTRAGLPQVLMQSVLDQSGEAIPVVTYQPYGNGQTIVVEGAGMWRWAFLPPQHAAKDNIYPALWQSLVQWIISQQDMLPGQKVGIRSDRATFLTGDRSTATVLVRAPEEFENTSGQIDLEVLLEGPDLPLPKRFTVAPSGKDAELFRVDFGTLNVGYYAAKVVRASSDQALAETALEVRDPWFEQLELDARPDVMRRVAQISGGEVLDAAHVSDLAERFRERLEANRPTKMNRTTLWDRPLVLLVVLGAWLTSWVVRRRSGLV